VWGIAVFPVVEDLAVPVRLAAAAVDSAEAARGAAVRAVHPAWDPGVVE
jgi:hypothetical protein